MDENLELLFQAKDFEGMWAEINSMYKYLGFQDQLTDAERINEYQWINKQLRKYMFSKQDAILAKESNSMRLAAVEALIGSATEYGSEREQLVYNFLRDHWLYEVYNVLQVLTAAEEEEVE